MCHDVVWNNDGIKIGGNTVFWGDFLQSGFKYVKDFFNTEGKPLTFAEAVGNGIKTNDFLKWNGLISAFPRELRQYMNTINEGGVCTCNVGGKPGLLSCKQAPQVD